MTKDTDHISRAAVLAKLKGHSDAARKKMAAFWEDQDGENYDAWGSIASHLDIASDAIRALPAAPVTVQVKPLEWTECTDGPHHAYVAWTPFGRWQITVVFLEMNKAVYRLHLADHPTLESAKAAAQADYAARIMAALDVQPAPDAMAQIRADAEARFADWFRKNYPGPDTIIHKPDWHAPKIFRAALAAMKGGAT